MAPPPGLPPATSDEVPARAGQWRGMIRAADTASMQLADLAWERDRIIRVGRDLVLGLPFDDKLALGIEFADQRWLIKALIGGELHHPHWGRHGHAHCGGTHLVHIEGLGLLDGLAAQERDVAAALAALGNERFEAGWAEGAVMPLPAASAEAHLASYARAVAADA